MIEELTAEKLGFPIDTPINNAKSVRQLCDQIWKATHDEGISEHDLCFRLSLLSGMAVAALLEYAKVLEGESNA